MKLPKFPVFTYVITHDPIYSVLIREYLREDKAVELLESDNNYLTQLRTNKVHIKKLVKELKIRGGKVEGELEWLTQNLFSKRPNI